MNLDDAQRKKVAEWIGQGLRLSDIQNRLASELGVRLTYMEVRLLVDDLKLTPKDPEPTKPVSSVLTAPAAPPAAGGRAPAGKHGAATPKPGQPAAAPAKVSLTVDELTLPGAVVSGKVTFTDGNIVAWQIDQMGQLRLMAKKTGYRPPADDLEEFQVALENELARLGL